MNEQRFFGCERRSGQASAACRSGWSRTAWSTRPACTRRSAPRPSQEDQLRHPADRLPAPPARATSRSPPPPNTACRFSTWTRWRSTWIRSARSSDKLLAKHRVLPLFKRGKRLFLGRHRPDQPARHRRDQVPDRPGGRGHRRRGRQAAAASSTRRIEQVDTSMPNLGDDEGIDLEALDVSGGEDELAGDDVRATMSKTRPSCASSTRCCSMPSAAAPRTSISSPTKRSSACACASTACCKEIAQPPVQLAGKISARLKVMSRLDIAERRVPQDGRIKMRLSKNARHRLPRQHLPDAVRREDRAAYPRSLAARCWASMRWATSRSRKSLHEAPGAAAGHDPGDRPHRQRQDRVAVHRPEHPQHRRHATSRPPKTRRKSTCPASTRSTSTTRWA